MDKPKRRIRYKGTHPRQFKDKYKELNPQLYPDEIQKAKAAGKTPAGSHRPICLDEILDFLNPRSPQTGVDATLGYGGHAQEILKLLSPSGRLFGFDLDTFELPKTTLRLRQIGYSPENFIPCQSNFAALYPVLTSHKVKEVDFILADLGVSSMQLDNPERGFSFKADGPLDLRLNPNAGLSAADFLKTVTEEQLVKILSENSDEEFAVPIASVIIKRQNHTPISSTSALTWAIREAVKSDDNKVIRRVFQALRIAVNNEFYSLEKFLGAVPRVLKKGGKVAVLTFHSGEDRRVKKYFKEGHRAGVYSEVARDVIRPSAQEVFSNPRASSAKLRWAIKA